MVKQISGTLTITIKKQAEDYTIEANGSKGIKVDPQLAPQLKALLSDQQITDTLKDLSSQTAPATTDAIQKLGKALYDSLFADRDLLLAFGKVQGSASSDSGARLRLQIEPIELAALPWETLYDGRELLSAQSTTPLVRKLALSNNRKPLQKLQVRGALRILFVGASPWRLVPMASASSAAVRTRPCGSGIFLGSLCCELPAINYAIIPASTSQLRMLPLKPSKPANSMFGSVKGVNGLRVREDRNLGDRYDYGDRL